ncbi:hypothetical protein HYDPIDRAFT_32958 [Hydnomerulius pinastri MD-312]|uniref:DUF6830 domain-containing protein n=1 Tax=Hydnomerulius pinastri MD-312 TaxID=994086 RepID=A0A0C9W1H6_9AGAM|nr:hypothetical protein HYDPIDRAFT_32958 [Hydnomerulius pinastri MD-312]
MTAPSLNQMPYSAQAIPSLVCPSCSMPFSDSDAVVQHLSNPGACGRWLAQTIPDVDFAAVRPEDDYTDDPEAAQDMYEHVDSPDPSDGEDETEYVETATGEIAGGGIHQPFPPEPETLAPIPSSLRTRVHHPNHSGQRQPGGLNHLQWMDRDVHANDREENVYFPFASASEWELANWLSSSALSQNEINQYLRLQRNIDQPVSFNTAKDLRARIEGLPEVPRWRCQEIKIGSYKTKSPLMLYWRDGLEVIKYLFSNPVFAQCIDLTPYREYEGRERVYGEFMSADLAWEIQSELPEGHSFLGVIGASDKTPLTIGTGNKEMHPLLLSIANIHAGVRMKATSHSFALAAYLPIPKFLNVSQPVQAILAARVYHFAISVVMKNLKIAHRDGAVMSDPQGYLRVIHTPLAAWIADYPEQLLIACVSSKNSPISTATAAQFGDPFPHPPRTRQQTLQAIFEACAACDPCDIIAFHKVCQQKRLSGVVEPFWADWGSACPSLFLTPDALHQWHKFYFDHCLRWVTNIMTGPELDRRLSVLQPRIGTRHWANGVSTLKQCTGREHRDLEKLLPAVSMGAIPDDVLCAIRSITEFIFLAQDQFVYDETLHALTEALREFHHFKPSIIAAGGRRGKNGPLDHFQIPKLELTQHVVRSTRAMGAPYQWSSDITERCHITHVKTPYRLSNRRNFHIQCCRFLDRREKQRFFQLFTTLKTAGMPLFNEMVYEARLMQIYYPESTWIESVLPGEHRINTSTPRGSVFNNARAHLSSDNSTAILLTLKPHFPDLSIDDASQLLSITDLRPALGDFFAGRSYMLRNGRRISPPNCSLPFSRVHVWSKFRMQQHSAQNPFALAPPQTIQAAPPSFALPFGRANTVLIAHESGDPTSDIIGERYLVAQVKAILQPVTAPLQPPLLYVEFFNFSNAHFVVVNGVRIVVPTPKIDMFLVHRRLRSNKLPLGDIIPMDSVRQVIQLIPKFGAAASPEMTCDNCLDVAREFYINSFADKETFHAILSYQ